MKKSKKLGALFLCILLVLSNVSTFAYSDASSVPNNIVSAVEVEDNVYYFEVPLVVTMKNSSPSNIGINGIIDVTAVVSGKYYRDTGVLQQAVTLVCLTGFFKSASCYMSYRTNEGSTVSPRYIAENWSGAYGIRVLQTDFNWVYIIGDSGYIDLFVTNGSFTLIDGSGYFSGSSRINVTAA